MTRVVSGMKIIRLVVLMALSGWLLAASPAATADVPYDPLSPGAAVIEAPLDLPVHDEARHRDFNLLVYLPTSPPSGPAPAPVLLFSHGLGGSRQGSAWLARHWAAHGYVVVMLQHPGSDNAVWEDVAKPLRAMALKHAANAENLILRAGDVHATLDALERGEAPGSGSPLAGRLDLGRVGMSGHSFGAVTTQAVGGEEFVLRRGEVRRATDPRIRAALMMSPSAPRRGTPAQAFGHVEIPWFVMTGTLDASPIGGATPESRLQVFDALPKGAKYELVLEGAEHSAFGDRALPGETHARNPNHHRAILALSTAFWDATLKGDPDARDWLDGTGPSGVLEAADRWTRK
jgi:dienelactone hydrolase